MDRFCKVPNISDISIHFQCHIRFRRHIGELMWQRLNQIFRPRSKKMRVTAFKPWILFYDKNKEKFSNRQLDFLNDRFVFDAICGYLEKSASIYIDKLREKAELKEQKETLVSTYGVVSGESASMMIQGVEDYLSEYENKRAE